MDNLPNRVLTKQDYMDEDVAYLIGLLTAKGKLIEDEDNKRLVIDFPYRNLFTSAPEESGIKFSVPDKIKIGLFDKQKILQELLGEDVFMEESEGGIQFVAKFDRNTMVWRNIVTIMQEKTNSYEFEVNPLIYEMPQAIQKCFVRGFADASSMPSEKDSDQIKRHRIVLQFPHDNWILPIQMCRLIQEYIELPVCHILWGHPSMNRGLREHRMRIFPENFLKIGYGFKFKQDILIALIDENKKNNRNIKQDLCNPRIKKITRRKKIDKSVYSDRLPEIVRRHFNSYWKLCQACGCKQGKKMPQTELTLDEDNIDNE